MSEYSSAVDGVNVQLALARRQTALSNMDSEAASLRGSGFNLEPAMGPTWDRSTWEAYRAQFGKYPFDAANKPPDVLNAPLWVKQLCGVRLNPAERMGGGGR
jgi:hypothetical protein